MICRCMSRDVCGCVRGSKYQNPANSFVTLGRPHVQYTQYVTLADDCVSYFASPPEMK
jgi:hypothetical protein